ncbi:uncharacterized protein LOC130782904 [Actinidia eriantha]|uniref:uncharacterized protein LOC130782904 n=1 Tax=Actinidia eriantha TaxID=165200 RepID=UPI00258A9849|nr:uncharacterized protein LOC130782904 [Actinidia eriantha]
MSKNSEPADREGKKLKEAKEVSTKGNASSSSSSSSTETGLESGKSSNLGLEDTNAAKDGESTNRIFLFAMRLTPSDTEKGRLSIPVEKALDHFPPLANRQKTYEEEAEISDTQNNYRLVTITYDRSECAFLIKNSLWKRFVDRHGLRVKDVIRFYRPDPCPQGQNRYLVDFVKRGEENEADNVPEFKQDNFLFGLPLTSCDVWYRRLVIPKAEVGIHFPGIRVPSETHKMERLNFTDKHNKSWCIKIVFNGHLDSYMLINGWEGFVQNYNLEEGGTVKFYKPVQPFDSHDFLIDYVERREVGTSSSQSGTEKNDGSDERGGGHKQGDREGRKKSRGGGSRKGKKKCGVEHCCMA